MPILGSRGGGSTRGFGTFGKVPVIWPSATTSFNSLASYRTTDNTITSFSFTSITSGYKHLMLTKNTMPWNNNAPGIYTGIRFNSDSGTNYNNVNINGGGYPMQTASPNIGAGAGIGGNSMQPGNFATYDYEPNSGWPDDAVFYILNYKDTSVYKTILVMSGYHDPYYGANPFPTNGGNGHVGVWEYVWKSTSAISSINFNFTDNNGARAAGPSSTYSIYGID